MEFPSVAPTGFCLPRWHRGAPSPWRPSWVGLRPGQLHLDLRRDLFQCPRVWLLQIKAWIVQSCSSRSESTQHLGRTPAGPTKSQTVSLRTRAVQREEERGRAKVCLLHVRGSSVRQQVGAGVGEEIKAAGVSGGTGVRVWLSGQSTGGGRDQGQASFHTFQPRRPGRVRKLNPCVVN